ncbi:voltage-gated potassium channel [Bathymodiolus platifrons methanotrophic gill symbiont]|uniref:potassium channel family protein n=1 Tax=Bathymodiolus platifrons methanotrophic gill symbiont TaxID=113268 RepID=UPI000B418EA5|nr:NAD-binding protein [Bathymodiolus platifrons methanotrophic gill symbiont]MCK5871031.1 potassium channel protein [Methyloprofundus sp.]TXK96609.1 potassium transporter TrkA [Methylococcaceae bacterium CS4]TXK99874.1 potassium transporter TrkA [Methylococcaceae bacterium CS5]TXL07261.1 potassium transporter TrkA [Methylococcaceae bacterium CS3]TXL10834.1 potassium transporter TrkA [Methylococcaceae bacterium CS2]TXL16933.1 potassium transporter TrkA [Methylococcaceae bacterium HT3]
MDNKLIAIFGYNSMSFELISQLSEKQHNLLILDDDPEKIELAEQKGLPAQLLDYRQDDELVDLGIGSQVATLFCFLEKDSENVFLTLSARALDQQLKIIAVVNHPDSAEKLLAAGASKIIDPYEICSNKVYQLLTKPSITWVLDQAVFGRADLHMAEITIPEHSILDKTLTSQLNLNMKYNLFLIGVVDKELGDKLYFSLGEQDHKLDVGDILVVLGANRDIRKFKKDIGVIQ